MRQPAREALGALTADREDEDEADDVPARRRRATEEFRHRIEQGDYRGLFDRRLSQIIGQAAEARGLTDEIGALRFVLARLLAEEEDPAKLAASVARVAGVAVSAARAQRAISGDLAESLTEALTQILTELDDGG